jgi:hypothetical protein
MFEGGTDYTKQALTEANTDRSLRDETRSLEISDDCMTAYCDSRKYDTGHENTIMGHENTIMVTKIR